MVEEDNTPLSVTVTPCDAPLEWTLSLQELPEAASGEGSGKRPEAYGTHSPPVGRRSGRMRSAAGDFARRGAWRGWGVLGGPHMAEVLVK